MNKSFCVAYFFLLFIFLALFSCSTLRKEPPQAKGKSKNTAPVQTATASRAPVRKPSSRPTAPSKPAPVSRSPDTRLAATYSSDIRKVVEVARTYAGTPYRSGGNDKNGIDCSGLICSVYSEIGFKVPRISWQQSEFGAEVSSIREIQPGDWVFFVPEAGKEGYVSHAGIVTSVQGDQEIMFIHASTSKGVREDNLFSNYFKGRFVKAMRPLKP
jgi:probable lipoprotein NlpC